MRRYFSLLFLAGIFIYVSSATAYTLGRHASLVHFEAPAVVDTGSTFPVTVVFLNKGTVTWTHDEPNPYRLGATYDNPTFSPGRIALPSCQSVLPGHYVTFEFSAIAPATPGTYPYKLKMLQEGVEWFGAIAQQYITVKGPGDTVVDAMHYIPNQAQSKQGKFLAPDGRCVSVMSPSHTIGWAFRTYGTGDDSGLSFRSQRDAVAGYAYQDWQYDKTQLTVYNEFGEFPTPNSEQWNLFYSSVPPFSYPLLAGLPRYPIKGPQYSFALPALQWPAVTATTFSQDFTSPPAGVAAFTGYSGTQVVTGGPGEPLCHGDYDFKASFGDTVNGPYEIVYVGERVPSCGTETYHKGIMRWIHVDGGFTPETCVAADGEWIGGSGGLCVTVRADYCWGG